MAEQNLMQDLSKITKKLLINDIFYGLFLSTIEKKADEKIPFAAVGLNKATMEFSLIINPIEWFKLSDEVKYGLLKHEALHLCMFHLITMDKYSNHTMDNIACDLEINQMIKKEYLPTEGCFIENFTKEYPQLDWRAMAGRDHYYKELSKLPEDEKKKLGIDEKAKHVWIVTDENGKPTGEELTESQKDAIRVQIESTIESIAEEVKKSTGHLPMEIDKLVSGFVKPKPAFNYQKYIRNYVGNSTRYTIGSSRIRENQRFPGQPKIILKTLSKVLVGVDQSGSVSEKELFEFLNELAHLSKQTDIQIHAFDTQVYKETKYRKGSNEFKRTACGGTDLQCIVDFYNESKDFNSLLIFTDGHFSRVNPPIKKTLVVISSNGTTSAVGNFSNVIKIPAE